MITMSGVVRQPRLFRFSIFPCDLGDDLFRMNRECREGASRMGAVVSGAARDCRYEGSGNEKPGWSTTQLSDSAARRCYVLAYV